MLRWFVLTGASLVALTSAPAFGQSTTPGDSTAAPAPAQATRTTAYDAAFFAQFAPRTAYDIAQHVPGFSLDLGNTDIRGFAAAAGNVVINGARPSSKAESLQTTLQRIPASQVTKVEVGSGDLYGAEYSSKSQVLNIIMSAQSGIDANVTLSGNRRYTGYVNTDASGSALIRRGPASLNLAAGTGRNKQYEEGTDTLTIPDTDEVIEFRRKFNTYFNKDPYLSAAGALEYSANSAFRLNARWQPTSFDLNQRNRVTPEGGDPHDDNLFQHYQDPVVEVGGDVTRPLAGGAIKFVGLATRRKRHDLDVSKVRNGLAEDGATIVGGFKQLVKAQRNETIGRLTWTRSNLLGMSFEAGGEAAYNTLDSDVDLFAFDENGNTVPIDLPGSNATAEEKRGEVYFSLGKQVSSAVRVDGGVNYEFSHLTVGGDAEADRKLSFIKPNVAIDWKPKGGWHARLSVQRVVAQLDFYDFISTAEFSTNRINGGNANLQPQQTWQFRFTGEHPLLGQGLIKLDLGYDLVNMLQDRVLLFDDQGHAFDAPGNLGTGKRYFGELNIDAPLDVLWKGLHAKFDIVLQHTSVEDPISHEDRKWTGFYPAWNWNIDIRRDIGAWSYGFTVFDNQRFTFYRTDEFDTNFNGSPYWTAFAEYRPGPRTSLRFDVDNVFQSSGNRNRLRFFPDRSQPDQVINEFRERNRHISLGLTLKQSFGGGGGVAK